MAARVIWGSVLLSGITGWVLSAGFGWFWDVGCSRRVTSFWMLSQVPVGASMGVCS
jgi:hypothetical protein